MCMTSSGARRSPVVDSTIRWDAVKAMWVGRWRGHGWVKRSLEELGVARSSGYRWEGEVRELLASGGWKVRAQAVELARLRGELEAVRREASGRGAMSRRQELRFVLHAAVVGTSDTETALLLKEAGGRGLSHTAIGALVAWASVVASVAYEQYFEGFGRTAAADEIYLGGKPLLLMGEPLSLLVTGARLSVARGGKDWVPVFERMRDLAACGADGGPGIHAAAKEEGVPVHGDMFHLLGPGRLRLAGLARRCEGKEAAAERAAAKLAKARFRGDLRSTRSALTRGRHAGDAGGRLLEAYCELHDLFTEIEGTFDYSQPDGRLQSAAEARATVSRVLDAMEKTPEGRLLARDLAPLRQPGAMRFHEVLGEQLRPLGIEQVGPDREARLARLVADTLAWRRRNKCAVSDLEAASNGSLADAVEIAVVRAVDLALRSSSAVECINSRVRLVQVARKRLSGDFVCLLAVYHNMRPFGRGSVREGHTAAELAGVRLPTTDWIELLETTAKDLGVSLAAA